MRMVIWALYLGLALFGCADRSPDLPQTTSTVRLAIVGQALIEHDSRHK
ncbi:MAG: hypothetical protein VX236_05200 [Pseudomonadota bacterium]|nr:hypothetical protein [Pseudomonadota bacterium]